MEAYFKGLRTVIYKVTDLIEAKKWYALVFNTEPYFDEDFYVGFNIAGYELGLQPSQLPSPSDRANVVAYWAVDDIHESFERLLELGATSWIQPKNVGGELMVATVLDPWKNAIGIIYNPYFKIEEN